METLLIFLCGFMCSVAWFKLVEARKLQLERDALRRLDNTQRDEKAFAV